MKIFKHWKKVVSIAGVVLLLTAAVGLYFEPEQVLAQSDPAYTEVMDSWDSSTYGTDGTWSDYDIFTNHSVPKGAVAEVILSNQEPGVEALTGIRTDGSSIVRFIDLHEAEGSGVTTARMFVLVDASTGLVETYSEDISDANIFYLVGYWENVSFTEDFDYQAVTNNSAWNDVTLTSGYASRVATVLLANGEATSSPIAGVRENGSSLERKIQLHEAENGGRAYLDFLVKADANYKVEVYYESGIADYFYMTGYFGSELDFVELFQDVGILNPSGAWRTVDLSAYLDQDGRTVDMLLLNHAVVTEYPLGVRDGDDNTTERKLEEHEAEDDGSATGEQTGFGISVTSNITGVIQHYVSNNYPSYADYMLVGYFKPAAGGASPDISNTPATSALGTVVENSSYWSKGSAPTFPLDDAECFFTVTNNSGAAADISIESTNFTGGNGWTLSSSVGQAIVVLKAGKSGDANEAAMVTLTTSPQSFITSLADSGTKKWEVKLDVGTFTDGVLKECTITLTATLS